LGGVLFYCECYLSNITPILFTFLVLKFFIFFFHVAGLNFCAFYYTIFFSGHRNLFPCVRIFHFLCTVSTALKFGVITYYAPSIPLFFTAKYLFPFNPRSIHTLHVLAVLPHPLFMEHFIFSLFSPYFYTKSSNG